MSRWGWHCAFTCIQPSIPTIGYDSVEPGWLHWDSVSPLFFCRPRCLGAACQLQLNRLSDHRVCLAVLSWVRRSLSASAADVRLQQLRRGFIKTTTCALLFSVHIKGVIESARSASYRKSMHALYDSLTVASFTLQTREFIPRELAHESRMNTSAGKQHHFSLTYASQVALTGRSSPQQRRQQRATVVHPPLTSSSMSSCRRVAILGSCAAAQTAAGVRALCRSLCPADWLSYTRPGLWFLRLRPSYVPAETKAPRQGRTPSTFGFITCRQRGVM